MIHLYRHQSWSDRHFQTMIVEAVRKIENQEKKHTWTKMRFFLEKFFPQFFLCDIIKLTAIIEYRISDRQSEMKKKTFVGL